MPIKITKPIVIIFITLLKVSNRYYPIFGDTRAWEHKIDSLLLGILLLPILIRQVSFVKVAHFKTVKTNSFSRSTPISIPFQNGHSISIQFNVLFCGLSLALGFKNMDLSAMYLSLQKTEENFVYVSWNLRFTTKKETCTDFIQIRIYHFNHIRGYCRLVPYIL